MSAKCILWGTTGACAYETATPKKMSATAKNLMGTKVVKRTQQISGLSIFELLNKHEPIAQWQEHACNTAVITDFLIEGCNRSSIFVQF